MNASIISTGDELLIGKVVNTNASFIADKLISTGINVRTIINIGDNEEELLKLLNRDFYENDFLILTGGLGPTHDDVTKRVLCKFFNSKLIINTEIKENIKRVLNSRNLPWTSAAEEQSLVPDNCQIIPNKHGTAAGMIFERDSKYLIAMPGVPYEMSTMMTEYVIPLLKKFNPEKVILNRTIKTTGIPEAFLSELLGNIDEIIENSKLAFIPSPYGVNLRIDVESTDIEESKNKISIIENRIRSKAEKYIYGIDDEELEEVIGKLLTDKKLTIAVAESCTGGLIANRITNISGSSKYFERGVVVYSNKSKIDILGIPENLIVKHGAVSKEVAQAMAENIRKISNTDIGISTTGIAGPTGSTPEKPVGLVWIGYSDNKNTYAQNYNFGENRERIKIRASQAALELVRKNILNIH